MNRLLKSMILASVGIHVLIALGLIGRPLPPASVARGRVDVQMIAVAPTHASTSTPRSTRGRAHLPPPEPEPRRPLPTATVAATAAVVGAVGDPQARADAANEYLARVTEQLNAHKVYPSAAAAREQQGRVMVGVTLAADGHVLAVEVEQPCAFALLNAAALETVRAVGIFPQLTPALPTPLHLHIPLVFELTP